MICVVPVNKRAFNDDWMFVMPGFTFGFEFAQAILFLGTPPSDPVFWVLLLFQGVAGLYKNTGLGEIVRIWFYKKIGSESTEYTIQEAATFGMSVNFGALFAPLGHAFGNRTARGGGRGR